MSTMLGILAAAAAFAAFAWLQVWVSGRARITGRCAPDGCDAVGCDPRDCEERASAPVRCETETNDA